jgi:hypothetical protein
MSPLYEAVFKQVKIFKLLLLKMSTIFQIFGSIQKRGPERSLRSLYDLDRKLYDAGLSRKSCGLG